MKKDFSAHWKSSKQPRKQRKYLANAPLHIKKKLMSVNLSKELRKKYSKRSLPVKKKDVVKIMKGRFKGKKGKVTKALPKMQKVEIEGIQVKKQDGSKVSIRLEPSNLQIMELNLEDKKRNKILKKETGKKQKEEEKSKNKFEKKKIGETNNASKNTKSA